VRYFTHGVEGGDSHKEADKAVLIGRQFPLAKKFLSEFYVLAYMENFISLVNLVFIFFFFFDGV